MEFLNNFSMEQDRWEIPAKWIAKPPHRFIAYCSQKAEIKT
jgi:hypothetical protein